MRPPAAARCCAILFAIALPCQESDDALRRREQRAWDSLVQRPRPGAAFDLWVGAAQQGERLDALDRETREYAAEHPEQAGPALILGMLLEHLGREAQALEAFARAEVLDSRSHLPPFLAGRLHLRARERELAVEALRRALRRDPPAVDEQAIAQDLGRALLELDRADEALAVWTALLDRHPQDAHLREEIAELLTREGRHEAALQQWSRRRDQDPGDPFVFLRCELEIGALLVELGRHGEACERATGLLERFDPQSWQAERIVQRLEELYLDAGDAPGWEDFLRARLQRRPGDVGVVQRLARVLAQCGRPEEALAVLDAAQRRAPGDGALLRTRIELLRALDRPGEVADALRGLIALEPQDRSLAFDAARAELQGTAAGRVERALDHLQQAVRAAPSDPAVALRAGEVAEQLASLLRRSSPGAAPPAGTGELIAAAESFLREAARRAPTDTDPLAELGALLLREGRAEEAVSVWWSMAAPPCDPRTGLPALARQFERAGFLQESLEAARRAVEQAPDDLALADELVRRLLLARDADDALAQLDRLEPRLLEDPDRERALRRRIEALDQRGERERELERLRRRCTRDDAGARDLWLLSILDGADQRLHAAADHALRAAALEPDNVPLAEHLGELLEQTGGEARAAALYRDIARLQPGSRTAFLERAVELDLRIGQLDRAAQTAEALLRGAMARGASWELRARVERERGDLAACGRLLRRAVRHLPEDLGLRRALARHLVQRPTPSPEDAAEACEHLWQGFVQAPSLEDRLGFARAMAEVANRAGDEVVDPVASRLRRHMLREPDDGLLPLSAALFLAKVGRAPEAAALLDLGRLRVPDDPGLLRTAVAVCREVGLLGAGADYQARRVALQSTAEALHLWADLLHAGGREAEAQAAWVRMMREHPDDPRALDEIDRRARGERMAEARAMILAGLQAHPDDWRLLVRAAYVHRALGEDDATSESLRSLVALPLDPGVWTQEVRDPSTGEEFPPSWPILTRRRVKELGPRTPLRFVTAGRAVTYRDGQISVKTLPGSRLDPILANAEALRAFSRLEIQPGSAFAWPALPIFTAILQLQARAEKVRESLRRFDVRSATRSLPWEGLGRREVAGNAFVLHSLDRGPQPQPTTAAQIRGRLFAELAGGLEPPPAAAVHWSELADLSERLGALEPGDPLPPSIVLMRLDRSLDDPGRVPRPDLRSCRAAVESLAATHPSLCTRLWFAFCLRTATADSDAEAAGAMARLAEADPSMRSTLELLPHVASLGREQLTASLLDQILLAPPPDDPDQGRLLLLALIEHGLDRHLEAAAQRFLVSLASATASPASAEAPERSVHVHRSRDTYDLIRLDWPSPTADLDELHCVLAEALARRFAAAGRLREWIAILEEARATRGDERPDRRHRRALQQAGWIARWRDGAVDRVLGELAEECARSPGDRSLRDAHVRALAAAGRIQEAFTVLAPLLRSEVGEAALATLRRRALEGDAELALQGLLAELEGIEEPLLAPYLPDEAADEAADEVPFEVADENTPGAADEADETGILDELFHSLGAGPPPLRRPAHASVGLDAILSRARDTDRLHRLIAAAEALVAHGADEARRAALLARARAEMGKSR